jgi:hypothetical protein
MEIILAVILTLTLAYTTMHYTLSTFWGHREGKIAVSAVFAVLVAIFVGVFTASVLSV